MNGKERNVLERLETKIDEIHTCLFNPDNGLYARVEKNTRWRKFGQWALSLLLSGTLLGVITLLFYVIKKGF